MNALTIKRQSGNVPKSLQGEDHISGLLFYVPAGSVPEAFATEHVQAAGTIEAAEALGITADAGQWAVRVMHHQLAELFRINPGVTLYVGVWEKPTKHTFAEVRKMQAYAGGSIRQLGVWDGATEVAADNMALLQSVGDALDLENAPLSIIYAPKVGDYRSLPTDLAGACPRVSVCVAQSGSGTAAELHAHVDNAEARASVSALGVAVGHLSAAGVHQSIAWVKRFPSGISLPALGDGTLVRNVDAAWLQKLDKARYLFLRNVVGVSGSYWNDSPNLDSPVSDYSSIELVRVMDKAVRGIRTYLTPELGGNVYVDPDTGRLQPYTCSHLETTANRPLEDMEKAGELSGYKAVVPPEQDVLSTGTVEVVIQHVAVGVMRRMNINIGYVKKLS